MVFFAFHHYLASKFHLNNFLAGNYISVPFATWNDVSLYFVSNISQVILVFSFYCFYFLCFIVDIYAMQERSHNISHLRKKTWLNIWLNFEAFFYKIFEEFNNDLNL